MSPSRHPRVVHVCPFIPTEHVQEIKVCFSMRNFVAGPTRWLVLVLPLLLLLLALLLESSALCWIFWLLSVVVEPGAWW